MPTHPLVREIAILLCIKVVALLLLFFAFFGPQHRQTIDDDAVARSLLSKPAQTETKP
ncbi:MAG: phosphoglycerate mutase [Alphaproteobacteria bacterium]|jgi:hypothetical protein|nr:phosphoglycerate mutase [Alphaproteobacteria bacterium]